MISAYENYEDKDEFDELLSLNVDIVRAMIANGRFSKAAFEGVYRALPVVDKSGHTKDAGPNPKEIAIVEENIYKADQRSYPQEVRGLEREEPSIEQMDYCSHADSRRNRHRMLSTELV